MINRKTIPKVLWLKLFNFSGSNVNKQRKGDDWTPLFVAAMLGRQEVALLLLQAGADTRITDNEDRTAEIVARQYGHHMVADAIIRFANQLSFFQRIHLQEFLELVLVL